MSRKPWRQNVGSLPCIPWGYTAYQGDQMRRCIDCGTLMRVGSRCTPCQRAHSRRRSDQRGPSGYARQRLTSSVLDRDGHRCALCALPCPHPRHHAVDHIVELADGGAAMDATNLRALCAACHQAKTNMARRRRTGARRFFRDERPAAAPQSDFARVHHEVKS